MARNKPLVFDAVDLGKQWANSGQTVGKLWSGYGLVREMPKWS